jgi:hypothetical protein
LRVKINNVIITLVIKPELTWRVDRAWTGPSLRKNTGMINSTCPGQKPKST